MASDPTTRKYAEILRDIRSECIDTVETIDEARHEGLDKAQICLEVAESLRQFINALEHDLGAI